MDSFPTNFSILAPYRALHLVFGITVTTKADQVPPYRRLSWSYDTKGSLRTVLRFSISYHVFDLLMGIKRALFIAHHGKVYSAICWS